MAHVQVNQCNGKFVWTISIAFWLSLLVASTLYAAVAIAPKLSNYIRLRSDHFSNQVRLVDLERRIEYLQKVAIALEQEPEFAAELARVEFDAVDPRDRRIPLQNGLCLDGWVEGDVRPPHTGALPWYTPLVDVWAKQSGVRSVTLTAAALLTIVAFTFFQESQQPLLQQFTSSVQQQWRRAWRRYATSHSVESAPSRVTTPRRGPQ